MNFTIKFALHFALLFILCLTGCESPTEEEPTQTPTGSAPEVAAVAPEELVASPLLQQPLEAAAVELPTEALAAWRPYRRVRPALILLANDPFLQPLPDALRQKSRALILQEDVGRLRAGCNVLSADPVWMPQMAVSAAVDADLFSEILWVFPLKTAPEEISVERFREQLVDFGALNEDEAATLQLQDGVITGTVRDLPFRAAPLAFAPALEGPAVLHLDLGYFQPLYKGEIKTPLIPLLYQTLIGLRKTSWQIAGASLSLGHIDRRLPLETRFVGDIVAQLFADPARLDAPPPENWAMKGNALYLENFFQKEKIRDIYLSLEQKEPENPDVKFSLYRLSRQFKEGTAALDYLAQAVELDRVYGIEYLTLADTALSKERSDQALRMLDLAAEAFPEDPFLPLQTARLLIDIQHGQRALSLIDSVADQPWSPVYFPQMNEELQSLRQAAQKVAATEPTPPEDSR